MEEIVINPETNHVNDMATAVYLHNEFIRLGFPTRRVFLALYFEYFEVMHEDEVREKLIRWWTYRTVDAELNEKIEILIDKLKNE